MIGLFERALALDPLSVEAQSWLADTLATRVIEQITDSAAADIERAEGLSRQALAASPRSALAHYVRGHVLRAQRRCEEAIPEYETALTLNPNGVGALADIGWCKLSIGPIQEVIGLVEQAIRLSPQDPYIGYRYSQIGRVRLLQSSTDEAILWLEMARDANPGHPLSHTWLASAYALKGDSERAAGELAKAKSLVGDDRFSSIAHVKATGYWGVPTIQALFETTYFAGLRKAGMPEE
jgi:tetratricopeptide (TPR) repeat protein